MKISNKVDTAVSGGELSIDLFGPGMTSLHRAGLAGLWMTLSALEKDDAAADELKSAGGSWELSDRTVILRWDREPGPFFNALFKHSFKIDNNGLIWFPALGIPLENRENAVVLQESILGSFLQHGKKEIRESDPAANPTGDVVVNVSDYPYRLRFHRLFRYAHQHASFCPTGWSSLVGWLLPGAAVRHAGLGKKCTAIENSPEQTLCLRFAPVGTFFFQIHQRGKAIKPQCAVVLPEILSLSRYADARKALQSGGFKQLYASGTSDAGWKVLVHLKAHDLISDLSSSFCRVIAFGSVPWSSQQKSRVRVANIQIGSVKNLKVFALCNLLFSAQFVQPERMNPFWDVPQVPDLVAQNLSMGKDWWFGFANFVSDRERGNHIFSYERGGLMKMVSNPLSVPDGPEKTYVLACHEAWRRRLGQIGEKARREGSSFQDQVHREFERLRVALSRCKNAASLREVVTDLWARGGPQEALQKGWHDIITLLDDKNWRKAKDLSLLALASYQAPNDNEKK